VKQLTRPGVQIFGFGGLNAAVKGELLTEAGVSEKVLVTRAGAQRQASKQKRPTLIGTHP
jgi:hypothetical protein